MNSKIIPRWKIMLNEGAESKGGGWERKATNTELRMYQGSVSKTNVHYA